MSPSSTRRRTRQRNQVKGALFEVIVGKLLVKDGYAPIKPDNVYIRRSDGKVRGRGCWQRARKRLLKVMKILIENRGVNLAREIA